MNVLDNRPKAEMEHEAVLVINRSLSLSVSPLFNPFPRFLIIHKILTLDVTTARDHTSSI